MSEQILYEYGQAINFSGDIAELEQLLETIWQQRTQAHTPDIWRELSSGTQRLLNINPKGQIQARNYVGFIRGPNYTLHLLPKLYAGSWPEGPKPENLESVYRHVLWWLGYTPFLRVPHFLSGQTQTHADPLEILMGLFASLTRRVLSQSLFQGYESRSDELAMVRGRLDMPAYLRDSLTKARWHRIPCIYDSFELDNLLNRLIKRVARLLLPWTRRATTRQMLSEIVYWLDEVSDMPVQASDCDRVQLNPMFEDYRPVLDYCRLFLQNSVAYAYKPELKVFALLIPMERLYEQFLAGFLSEHQARLPGLSSVAFQKSDLYLADELLANGDRRSAFQLRHDLMLSYRGQVMLLDAKYKRLDPAKTNQGIAQTDLYQMVAYAGRRGTHHCGLIYPSSARSDQAISRRFEVSLAHWAEPISIQIEQIPMISSESEPDFVALQEELLSSLETILSRSMSTP